jgi:hypothetical protein
VDSGDAWTVYNTVSPVENGTGLADYSGNRLVALNFSKLANGFVVCKYKNSIQLSEDNGETWTWRIGNYAVNLGQSNIGSLFEHEFDGKNYLHLMTDVTSAGLWSTGFSEVTDTVGKEWVEAGYGIQRKTTGTSISGTSYTDSLIFATGLVDISVSHDNGATYRTINDNLSDLSNLSNSCLQAVEDRLYCIMSNKEVYYYDLTVGVNWNATPTLSDTTTASVNINYEADRYGLVYWVIVPTGSSAPTAKQIVEGKNADDIPLMLSGSADVVANSPGANLINNLNANTEYDLYTVVESKILKTTPVHKLSFKTKDDVNTDNISNADILSFYPNPNDGEFVIDAGNETVMVTITNIKGEIVYENLISGESLVNTDLNFGIYIINIKGDKLNLIEKLVIR